ncbi:MAG: DUF5615 family PIN-like protein [Anaerolineales bacterium]
MAKPKLHLDEDASKISLQRALLERGHDVTRTPNERIQLSASDEEQLRNASEKKRTLFSFNIRDFIRLAKRIPHHAGIIVSPQHPTPRLLKALDRFFKEITAEEMEDQMRWLSDWEK